MGKKAWGWGEGRGEGRGGGKERVEGRKGRGKEGEGGEFMRSWGGRTGVEGWRGSNLNYCIMTFVRCIFLATLTELSGPFLPT